MVSYFKTQWFRFLMGCFFLIIALVYLFQPAGDPTTLEGLQQDLKNEINTVSWLISSLLWFTVSFIDWNTSNLRAAEKSIADLTVRVEALEKQAITDLEEVNPNHFIARRRCGPDKDIPRPGQEPTLEARIKNTDKRIAYFRAAQKTLGRVPEGEAPIVILPSELRTLALNTVEEYEKV